MKKKFKFICVFMLLLIVFVILFPVIHSYEHIQNHTSKHKTTFQNHTHKGEFKIHNHSYEECPICHFKFSPVSTFSFIHFDFYKSFSVIPYVNFYFKIYSIFFKGSLFALRAPPPKI